MPLHKDGCKVGQSWTPITAKFAHGVLIALTCSSNIFYFPFSTIVASSLLIGLGGGVGAGVMETHFSDLLHYEINTERWQIVSAVTFIALKLGWETWRHDCWDFLCHLEQSAHLRKPKTCSKTMFLNGGMVTERPRKKEKRYVNCTSLWFTWRAVQISFFFLSWQLPSELCGYLTPRRYHTYRYLKV